MKKLRIAIADDHPLVLAGIMDLLSNDIRFEITGTVTSSSELISHITEDRPDVVITDFVMPGDNRYGDGLNLIGYLSRHFPDVKLLVVTMISNPLIVASLYKAGVSGVVLKSDATSELLRALENLRMGKRYVRAAEPVPPQPDQQPASGTSAADLLNQLSPKEIEVIRLFVDGQSLTAIANGLKRSIKTISNQKRSAMNKLNVTTDQDLIAFCIHGGLFL